MGIVFESYSNLKVKFYSKRKDFKKMLESRSVGVNSFISCMVFKDIVVIIV